MLYLDLDRAPYVLYGLQMTQYPFTQHGLRISNSYIAPLVLFKMACNLNLILRCVLIGLSTLGAGAKTRLESRIKEFTPHCLQAGGGAAGSPGEGGAGGARDGRGAATRGRQLAFPRPVPLSCHVP